MLTDLPELSLTQFALVDDALSLAFAIFLGSALFFFIAGRDISSKHRISVMISGVIVSIAAYHYLRLFGSWNGAYEVAQSAAEPTGAAFNEAYRYMDWIVTVPLLLVELILLLDLERSRRTSLLAKLVPAAFLMIALGYPGEFVDSTGLQWLWWALAMVPFLYILYALYSEVSQSISDQPEQVRGKFNTLRTLLVVTWFFYPIAYLFPILLDSLGLALVLENVGYAIADTTAKAGYGLVIYLIARDLTQAETTTASQPERQAA